VNDFENIFSELNKAKVKYLVVGGVAVNLHGFPRFTGDLDILLLLEEKNLKKIDKAMRKLRYSERLPISVMDLEDRGKVAKWMQEKNFKAFTFNPPYGHLVQIDIVIKESLKFERFFERKLVKMYGGVRIPVISFDDLVKMKKKTGREKDEKDLEVLNALNLL